MSNPPATRLEQIESWFHRYDDGDFSILPSDSPSMLRGDFDHAGTILYLTKRHCLDRIRNVSELKSPFSVIARYGLPTSRDLARLQKTSTSRIFIGDADPVDLLIFAWLREHLPITWIGVNDKFLEQHGTREIPSIRIPCSESETSALELLRTLCPDYRELLGPYCSSLMEIGLKIEVEGATTS